MLITFAFSSFFVFVFFFFFLFPFRFVIWNSQFATECLCTSQTSTITKQKKSQKKQPSKSADRVCLCVYPPPNRSSAFPSHHRSSALSSTLIILIAAFVFRISSSASRPLWCAQCHAINYLSSRESGSPIGRWGHVTASPFLILCHHQF